MGSIFEGGWVVVKDTPSPEPIFTKPRTIFTAKDAKGAKEANAKPHRLDRLLQLPSVEIVRSFEIDSIPEFAGLK
jgi:hypothetical protein